MPGCPGAGGDYSLPVILSGALAHAVIASIDALLCARLAGRPGELSVVRLGLANAISAGFGGITNGMRLISESACSSR
jgi:sulfate permease, SulP family